MIFLDELQWYQLTHTPQAPTEENKPNPIPAQLFAALTAAHSELSEAGPEPMLAALWQRQPQSAQTHILFGGAPVLPAAQRKNENIEGAQPILYPPGSLGIARSAESVYQSLLQFPYWIRCAGQSDPLWTPEQGKTQRHQRGGFDNYVAHFTDPFAWLVLVKPLSSDSVDRELLALLTQIPRLRQRENSELDRIALERAQWRYRELSRSRTSGMWTVHVLAGGMTATAAQRTAALLSSSHEFDELAYVLQPARKCAQLAEVLASPIASSTEPCSPFSASGELVAELVRPPRRELAGIHVVETVEFDVTVECNGTIPLGAVLDASNQVVGEFTVSSSTLNRHTFVAGATGAGKSQTVRHLLEGIHHAGVPWLVIEPAKAEYAKMAGRLPESPVRVIRPGDPSAIPVGLNPLEPEPGFALQTHIDLVRALFLAAFEATEPFPQVLSHALNRAYRDLGWNIALGEPRRADIVPQYPSLQHLRTIALSVVDDIGYGKEITDNVRGFIDVRIDSLRLGTSGRFFEGGHPLDVAELLAGNVVLEIEDIGTDQDKAFFIGAVLIRIYEYLRVHRNTAEPSRLRHVTVIEEAHRLLKKVEPGSPAAHAVELFASLLAEIRAYGEGIVIAEQIPAKIVPDVLKNTALKIMHRLPAADDREALGATMNLTEAQSRHVLSLSPGTAVVFSDGMDRPMKISIPLGEDREKTATAQETVPIARHRSTACGQQCQLRPCNFREIDQAQYLAEDPRLILWIELLTVAHLVAKPAPNPTKEWLDELTAKADQRTLECAVAHRINTAIESRYTGLVNYYQPEDLARHLAEVASGTIAGALPPCDGSEAQWQAGQYRWIDVFRALKKGGVPDHQPHPDTAQWAQRGLQLRSSTPVEQLHELQTHPDTWRPEQTIITGTITPSLIDTAVTQLSNEEDPQQRFLDATYFLRLRTTWPLIALDIQPLAEPT